MSNPQQELQNAIMNAIVALDIKATNPMKRKAQEELLKARFILKDSKLLTLRQAYLVKKALQDLAYLRGDVDSIVGERAIVAQKAIARLEANK